MATIIFKNLAQKLLIFQFLIAGLISGCNKPNDVALPSTVEQKPSNSKQNIDTPELILSAAASMQDVLREIEQLYINKYPQAKIIFNFGSSGSLQRQIEQGAPVDIFISAAPQQMNDLADRELILNETRQDLVKNQMVLVTPQDNQLINNFDDLIGQSAKQIALGDPNSVPAGKYAQEILTNLNLINDVKTKTVYGKDVRQVLNYVATGNIEAGIVYRTDLATTKKVKIVATALQATHSPAIYPIAVVKDSNHPEAAKQLLEFLFSPQAQAIFEKYGFMTIGKSKGF